MKYINIPPEDKAAGSALKEIARRLNEMKNNPHSRTKWINVKDKLPENDQTVVCWYEYYRYGEYNCMYQTCGIGHYINGYWGGEVSNGSQTKVLYWMPLPEQPIVDELKESE